MCLCDVDRVGALGFAFVSCVCFDVCLDACLHSVQNGSPVGAVPDTSPTQIHLGNVSACVGSMVATFARGVALQTDKVCSARVDLTRGGQGYVGVGWIVLGWVAVNGVQFLNITVGICSARTKCVHELNHYWVLCCDLCAQCQMVLLCQH